METYWKICASALLLCSFSSLRTSAQESDCAREKSAHKFIGEAREFQRQAFEYHQQVINQTREAKLLIAQAKKINSTNKKLRAGIKEDTTLHQAFSLDAKQYNLHLQEFQGHSKIYNAHLAEYEREILKAQAAEGQLKSSCKEFADHVQKFHIPGVRPPHICVQMQWENKELQKAARGFAEDQAKAQQVEADLAKQEAKLADAAHERAALEAKLLQKANLDELERTQGVMLLKEYQQIEREYRMLQQEKKSLPSK